MNRCLRPLIPALIVAILALVCAQSAFATSYFVSSSTGSDFNVGTSALAPWQSLGKVNSSALQPGDQVEFLRGDTWTGGLNLTHSGSSSARINLFDYGTGSSRPKIIGGLNGDCINVNASFVTVNNLEADNCGYAGVTTEGTDTTVQQMYISGNAVGVQIASGGTNVLVTQNTLVNNNVLNVNNSSGSSGAFGVLCNAACVVSYNNISGSDAASQAYGRDGSGVELYNAGNAWVHDNFMTDNNNGVEAGGSDAGAAVEYNVITNNTLGGVDTQPNGIVWAGSAGNLWAAHNSIDVQGSNSQGIVCYSTCTSGTTITSNAVAAQKKSIYVDSTLPAITGNVFNGPVQTGATLNSTNSTAAIKWVNPPTDLREQVGSPTVDHATVTNFSADIAGNPVPDVGDAGTAVASDAGALELQDGGPPPPPDTTAPSTPTGLNVTSPSQTSLTLNWTASNDNGGGDNIAGYNTFLNGSNNGSVTTTSKTYTGLTCHTTYTLGVQAFDQAGNKSGTATVQGTTAACSTGSIQHVVVIVMENHDASVLSQMPYLNGLASTYGQATNYYGIGHFSTDNYIAMTSGTTCCFDDSFQNLSGRQNIFGQLGSQAQTLAERGGGGYAQRHDPQVYYGGSSNNYTDGQTTDLSGKKFTFVVPGLCDDMHDCGPSTGDAWLSRNVPKFQANPNTAIFITFDEDSGGGQGTTTPPANHVAMVVVSPFTSHISNATQFNHYSLLRTVEDVFGLPALGSAASATSMVGHFGF